jgi:type I restriction enzyme S subunit
MAPRVNVSGKGDLEPLSVYLGAGVVRRADREDNHNQLGADLDKYLHVKPGDLVFNKLRTWQGGLGASKYEGIVSPAYYVLRTTERLDPRFANYTLISSPYLAELTRLSKFMPPSQFDMPWESLKRLPMLIPPLEEQRRIADFLDDQVSRIDEMIRLTESLAKIERERRDAQIGLAIQGGPYTDAQLEITKQVGSHVASAHWQIRQLRSLGVARLGLTYSPHDEVDSEVDGTFVIRSGNVQNGQIFRGDDVYVDKLVASKTSLELGDIVLCSRNGSAKLIGKSALIGPENVGDAWGAFMTVFRSPSNEYLQWVFRSPIFKNQLGLFATSTINQLTRETLLSFRIPYPPTKERAEIVNFLEKQLELAELTISKLGEQARLLAERKRAIITAAVTGNLDVTTAKPISTKSTFVGLI